MYQPKISEENIRKLYKLRLHKKMPMTRVLEEILNEYFDTLKANIDCEDGENNVKSIGRDREEKY